MNLIKALGNLTVLGVVGTIAWLFMGFRLDLSFSEGIVSGLAIAILIASIWLYNHEYGRVASAFSAVAVLTLLTITLDHKAPGVLHWGRAHAAALNEVGDQSADMQETPHEVTCAKPYFIGKEGRSKFWHAPSEQPVICYNRAGFHPVTREPLREVTQEVVATIEAERREQATATPSPAPPPPARVISPTPTPSATVPNNGPHWSATIMGRDLPGRHR
jgi:hypothetical protein